MLVWFISDINCRHLSNVFVVESDIALVCTISLPLPCLSPLHLSLVKHGKVGARLLATPRHLAYLKIAEGCRKRCSFCVIPLIKGALRSKPIDQVDGACSHHIPAPREVPHHFFSPFGACVLFYCLFFFSWPLVGIFISLSSERIELIFTLRPAMVHVTCIPGGAGVSGIARRRGA